GDGAQGPAEVKGFRYRGEAPSRLEGLSDCVFAFAITLLVVSLDVPRTFHDLYARLREFVVFAICFAQLVLVWWEHHEFFRRYALRDGITIWLNMALLFVVLFYVYPLKFLFSFLFDAVTNASRPRDDRFTNADVQILMRLYALGFAAVFALFALMNWHA